MWYKARRADFHDLLNGHLWAARVADPTAPVRPAEIGGAQADAITRLFGQGALREMVGCWIWR